MPAMATIAPGFVVATPALTDPNFERSVVLLVEHGATGSLGFVINRRAPFTFASIAPALGIASSSIEIDLLTGGPVAPETGWILYDPRTGSGDFGGDSLEIGEGLAITTSRRALEALGGPGAPTKRALLLGYAGWGEGQLSSEFQEGVWLPTTLDSSVVFDVPASERWARVLRDAGIDPARISSGGHSA